MLDETSEDENSKKSGGEEQHNDRYDPELSRREMKYGILLGLMMLFALIVIILPVKISQAHDKLWPKLALLFSAVAPPGWHWYEYIYIWREAKIGKRPTYEQFKYAQQVGRNLWLALVGVLLAIYFKG